MSIKKEIKKKLGMKLKIFLKIIVNNKLRERKNSNVRR
jgi:hypothetical protein